MPGDSFIPAASREVRLALTCARHTLSPEQQALVRGLATGDPLDEELLFSFVEWHGLTPLLHWHLEHCVPGLRAPWRERIRVASQRTLQWNLQLTAELRRLQALFASAGVRALAYKGPALAHSLYGHLGLRDSEDLDLLVRRADLDRAAAGLIAAGYLPEYDLTGDERAAHLARSCEWNFVHPVTGVMVELHWQVVPPALGIHFPEEELWRNAHALEFSGVSCHVPAAEVLLLALCVHGAKHMWERVSWLADIVMLTRPEQGLDHDRVRALAEAMGIERLLRLGVQLAHLTLDEAPPALDRGRGEDATAAALATALLQANLRLPHRSPSRWARLGFDIRVRDSWRDRARFLAAKLRNVGVRAPRRNPALLAAHAAAPGLAYPPAGSSADAASGSRP